MRTLVAGSSLEKSVVFRGVKVIIARSELRANVDHQPSVTTEPKRLKDCLGKPAGYIKAPVRAFEGKVPYQVKFCDIPRRWLKFVSCRLSPSCGGFTVRLNRADFGFRPL